MAAKRRILRPAGHDAAVAAILARKLDEANAAVDRAKEARQEIVDQLVAMCGDDYDGVGGDWGTFVYEKRPGRVRWEDLAQELYRFSFETDARIPKSTIEKHRGAPWFEPRLYLNEEREDHEAK